MPYGQSRLTAAQQLGDPFLGGLIKGIGRVAGGVLGVAGGLLPGPIGGIARGLGTLLVPKRRPPPALQVLQQPRGGIPGFPVSAAPPRPAGKARMPGVAPRRRRMNPLNVKALRRSTRRLAGFQREAKKVEKQLRKIAPQRRSSRRDLAPGHRHVR